MYDSLLYFLPQAIKNSKILENFRLKDKLCEQCAQLFAI